MITNRQHMLPLKVRNIPSEPPTCLTHYMIERYFLPSWSQTFIPALFSETQHKFASRNMLPSLPYSLLHLSSLISPFLHYFPIPRKGECGMEKRTLLRSSFLPSCLPFALISPQSSLLLTPHSTLIPSNLKIPPFQSKIVKRSWVLQECLYRVPEEYDAARELLEYGLVRTSFKWAMNRCMPSPLSEELRQ